MIGDPDEWPDKWDLPPGDPEEEDGDEEDGEEEIECSTE